MNTDKQTLIETDDSCSIPVPENSMEIPKLTQFSPGAG